MRNIRRQFFSPSFHFSEKLVHNSEEKQHPLVMSQRAQHFSDTSTRLLTTWTLTPTCHPHVFTPFQKLKVQQSV